MLYKFYERSFDNLYVMFTWGSVIDDAQQNYRTECIHCEITLDEEGLYNTRLTTRMRNGRKY